MSNKTVFTEGVPRASYPEKKSIYKRHARHKHPARPGTSISVSNHLSYRIFSCYGEAGVLVGPFLSSRQLCHHEEAPIRQIEYEPVSVKIF